MLGSRVGILSPSYFNPNPYLIAQWDASADYWVYNDGNPVTPDPTGNGNDANMWLSGNGPTIKWLIPNTPGYSLKYCSEVRNGGTYNYMLTHKITHTDYLHTVESDTPSIVSGTGSIKQGRTLFMVLRQRSDDHLFYEIMCETGKGANQASGINHMRCYHSQPSPGGDCVIGNYYGDAPQGELPLGDTGMELNVRIWAFSYRNGKARFLGPEGTDHKNVKFRTMNNIRYTSDPEMLCISSKLSPYNGRFQFYEIRIYDYEFLDENMLQVYQELVNKWAVN